MALQYSFAREILHFRRGKLTRYPPGPFVCPCCALPLDRPSPSVLCASVMLGRAGFAVDGNDGIG